MPADTARDVSEINARVSSIESRMEFHAERAHARINDTDAKLQSVADDVKVIASWRAKVIGAIVLCGAVLSGVLYPLVQFALRAEVRAREAEIKEHVIQVVESRDARMKQAITDAVDLALAKRGFVAGP